MSATSLGRGDVKAKSITLCIPLSHPAAIQHTRPYYGRTNIYYFVYEFPLYIALIVLQFSHIRIILAIGGKLG